MGFFRRLFKRKKESEGIPPFVLASYSWTNANEEAPCQCGRHNDRTSSEMPSSLSEPRLLPAPASLPEKPRLNLEGRYRSIDPMALKFFNEKLLANPDGAISKRRLEHEWIEWKKIPGNRLGRTTSRSGCADLISGLNHLFPGMIEVTKKWRGYGKTPDRTYHGISLK